MSDEHPASVAFHAFQAKEDDARMRLARCFIAFAKTPKAPDTELAGRKVKTAGYLIIGSSSGQGLFRAMNFGACFIGNPSSEIQEAGEFMREIQSDFADWLSDDDFHAAMAVKTISRFARDVLHDKDEPRAFAVEFLFTDIMENIHWCRYDGTYGGMGLRGGRKEMVVLGCYDKDLNRALTKLINERFLKQVPAPEALKTISKEIKKLTKLRKVGITPIVV